MLQVFYRITGWSTCRRSAMRGKSGYGRARCAANRRVRRAGDRCSGVADRCSVCIGSPDIVRWGWGGVVDHSGIDSAVRPARRPILGGHREHMLPVDTDQQIRRLHPVKLPTARHAQPQEWRTALLSCEVQLARMACRSVLRSAPRTARRLIWEYPRAAPDGEQMDFVEVMEVNRQGLIQRHCVYWGWRGVRVLQRDEYRR
jgi:hypothetical protein